MTGTLVDHISTGLVFVQGTGVIGFMNAAAETMLGISRDEAVGKRVDMLPLRTPLYKVLSENSRDNPAEISINGMVLLVRTSVMPAGTGVCGDLVEFRDITLEKRELRQREEFVAMMTHDLKSPLTVMMGYIQAMKGEDEADQKTKFCIQELDRSSLRLLGMIEDVLDAYRLEVGLLTISTEVADLRELLAGCCRDLAREAEMKGIGFEWSLPAQLPPVWVDRKQIVRVFANLLGNALKFTPRGGTVSLAASHDDDHVSVTITDTGIGIPEKDLSRIFYKYFRARTAAGYKGTGLGLAISKTIVDAHHGVIRVESREGAGSTFTVILPHA